MSWLSQLFERSEHERHLDNRVLTALVRGAGWEVESAQQVVTALALQRLSQPIRPAMVRTAVEDQLRVDLARSPREDELCWAVESVTEAVRRHEQDAS